VEANEEVQAHRTDGGDGSLTVTTEAEIYLVHFAPGQDDSTPPAERHRVRPDGKFSVLDGICICPEGVLIDRLGISFRLDVEYEKLDDDGEDTEFQSYVDFPLDATVALLNERLVFS
jgi:hypothetical protein